MEIYLVRHTAVDIAKGVCYGQADIGVAPTFLSEAAIIKQHLPSNISAVYSSPLKRCKKLAEHLCTAHHISFHNDLKEINCGSWEMQHWDNIPREEITPWIEQRISTRIPGGESYEDVYERVKNLFLTLHQQAGAQVIFTHGGVIRSILAYLTATPLQDSFTAFPLHYGCVIKITKKEGALQHQILSNIMREKETHRPSYL